MLSGFNTDIRHRGVLFHVQTEDSGLDNPHVITHLFYGGNILASEKQDYSDLCGQESIEEPVRKLMESQHKAMLKRLSQGAHDAILSERLGPDVFEVEVTEAEPILEPEFVTELPSQTTEKLSKPQTPKKPESRAPNRLSPVFGDREASAKPLDEVVLDYLVENARKRKRPPK